MTVADRFLRGVLSINRSCATFTENRPVFVFSTFVGELFCESVGGKSFRFPQVLIKLLSLELTIEMWEL